MQNILSYNCRTSILLKCHEIFSSIDHILVHKASFSKFKKTEIIPSIFSYHNGIKLGSITRGKLGNSEIQENKTHEQPWEQRYRGNKKIS